jgi:hypothetical protein
MRMLFSSHSLIQLSYAKEAMVPHKTMHMQSVTAKYTLELMLKRAIVIIEYIAPTVYARRYGYIVRSASLTP